MAIEKREVSYAKEADDVLELLVELVYDLRAKKEMQAIAGENLPHLMDALAGVDQVDDEWKEDRRVLLSTVGYRTGELTDAIIGPKKPADAE